MTKVERGSGVGGAQPLDFRAYGYEPLVEFAVVDVAAGDLKQRRHELRGDVVGVGARPARAGEDGDAVGAFLEEPLDRQGCRVCRGVRVEAVGERVDRRTRLPLRRGLLG